MREKDIENVFAEVADKFGIEVLGQQVDVPVGCIDILGWEYDHPIVIEAKRGKAGDDVLGQLLSYMHNIEVQIFNEIPAMRYLKRDQLANMTVQGYVLAKDIKKMTRRFLGCDWRLGFIQYKGSHPDELEFHNVLLKSPKVYLSKPPKEIMEIRNRAIRGFLEAHSKSSLTNWEFTDRRVDGYSLSQTIPYVETIESGT